MQFKDIKHRYCINLDHRKDRWEETIKELEKNSINNVRRFSAISRTRIKSGQFPMNPGLAALTLTVRNLVQHAIKHNFEHILILEDDIECSRDFTERVNNFLKAVTVNFPNWDMVYFGGNHIKVPHKTGIPTVLKLEKTYTSHAILIHSKMFERILGEIKLEKDGIDVIYSNLHPEIEAFAPNPYLITQRRSYSDIELRKVKYRSIEKQIE